MFVKRSTINGCRPSVQGWDVSDASPNPINHNDIPTLFPPIIIHTSSLVTTPTWLPLSALIHTSAHHLGTSCKTHPPKALSSYLHHHDSKYCYCIWWFITLILTIAIIAIIIMIQSFAFIPSGARSCKIHPHRAITSGNQFGQLLWTYHWLVYENPSCCPNFGRQ